MSLLQGLFQGLIVFIQVDTGVSGALAAESCPPEGGTPPAPTSPRCTHLQDQRWALVSRKFASDPFILYSLFYFRSLTPRDSLLGASHFFAKHE